MNPKPVLKDVVQVVRDRKLKKLRQAMGRDSKELYEKRLNAFIDELFKEL